MNSLTWRFLVVLGMLCATAFAQQAASQAEPAAPTAQTSDSSSEFAEARKLMQQGKIDDAITALQAIELRDPATKGVSLELGIAYYKKSDFPKAIEYLKKATAADPANNEAIQLLGLSYYLGGHPADAIPLLEKVQGWYSRANVDAAYILWHLLHPDAKLRSGAQRHLEKCSTFLETRPPRIYLQRACYCGRNTIRWRKNMRRRRSRSIPNCRWRISCSASCTSTNRARTNLIAGVPERTGHQPGARANLLQIGRCVFARAEV